MATNSTTVAAPLLTRRQIILTLGPMEVGNFANSFLMGILVMQGYHYFTTYRDPKWITRLVIFTLALDIAQTCIMMDMQWKYTVLNFGDLEYISRSHWQIGSIPFYSTPLSSLVQCFYAYRIQTLTGSWWLTVPIVVLSICSSLGGIGSGIGAFIVSTTSQNAKLQPVAAVWFICGIVCDAAIMTIMLWTLTRAKTGFKDTDTLITRINRTVIETGAATTITTLVDCLLFFLLPGTDVHLAPVMIVGKVYSNSFLYLLNSRGQFRNTPSTVRDFARTFDRDGAEGEEDVSGDWSYGGSGGELRQRRSRPRSANPDLGLEVQRGTGGGGGSRSGKSDSAYGSQKLSPISPAKNVGSRWAQEWYGGVRRNKDNDNNNTNNRKSSRKVGGMEFASRSQTSQNSLELDADDDLDLEDGGDETTVYRGVKQAAQSSLAMDTPTTTASTAVEKPMLSPEDSPSLDRHEMATTRTSGYVSGHSRVHTVDLRDAAANEDDGGRAQFATAVTAGQAGRPLGVLESPDPVERRQSRSEADDGLHFFEAR